MVSNEQLYLAVGIPLLFNATLVGVLIAYINAKIQGVEERLGGRLGGRIDSLEAKMEVRFDAIDTRFDDMRDLWRSELHRVEEVLAARLKHLEQSR